MSMGFVVTLISWHSDTHFYLHGHSNSGLVVVRGVQWQKTFMSTNTYTQHGTLYVRCESPTSLLALLQSAPKALASQFPDEVSTPKAPQYSLCTILNVNSNTLPLPQHVIGRVQNEERGHLKVGSCSFVCKSAMMGCKYRPLLTDCWRVHRELAAA